MEATAKNIDKTARTAHEMAEAQRDSFEALAENLATNSARKRGKRSPLASVGVPENLGSYASGSLPGTKPSRTSRV